MIGKSEIQNACASYIGGAIISVLFILLSILIFCMETHLDFRVPRNDSVPMNGSWTRMEKSKYSTPHISLQVLDVVCTIYFTLELILRITFAPDKRIFFRGMLNWVDVFAIIPFYLEQFMIGVFPQLEFTVAIEVLKSFSLTRIFRIFKLTRHFNGLKILAHSIKASARELILLILFLLITVLIFASCIYYAESIEEGEKNDFKNIPVGFWWAVVTMTTLGYGDMYPRTGTGYLVGGLCAVAGVLVLALPVPVIVNNFALYYSHAQARLKLPPKQKKILVGAADQLKTQLAMPGALEEAGLAPSPAGAHMGSNGSMNSSDDSGIKTGDSNASADGHMHGGGISVIFTDEVAENTRPPTPPNASSCNGGFYADMTYLRVSNDAAPPLLKNGEVTRASPDASPSPPPARRAPSRRRSLMPSLRQFPAVDT